MGRVMREKKLEAICRTVRAKHPGYRVEAQLFARNSQVAIGVWDVRARAAISTHRPARGFDEAEMALVVAECVARTRAAKSARVRKSRRSAGASAWELICGAANG